MSVVRRYICLLVVIVYFETIDVIIIFFLPITKIECFQYKIEKLSVSRLIYIALHQCLGYIYTFLYIHTEKTASEEERLYR